MEKNIPILDGIDPEIKDRLVTRRDAIRKGATASAMLTWGLSLGSVPVALAAMSKEAFAQGGLPQSVIDVLKFAFILENLENEFYKAVLDVNDNNAAQRAAFAPVRAAIAALPGGAGGRITPALEQIQKHEAAHVAFLRTALGSAAPTITANDFDFTGGNGGATPGPFARATSEPQFLMLAAQAFEDTGVRAYKGQVGTLLAAGVAADAVLEAALRIHSVEARHAAKVRNLRRDLNMNETVIRYSGTVRGGNRAAAGGGPVTPAPENVVLQALDAIYANEQNTSHVVFNGTVEATIDIAASSFTGLGAIGTGQTLTDAITEAFDESLSREQVIAIVAPFIKDDAGRGLP